MLEQRSVLVKSTYSYVCKKCGLKKSLKERPKVFNIKCPRCTSKMFPRVVDIYKEAWIPIPEIVNEKQIRAWNSKPIVYIGLEYL